MAPADAQVFWMSAKIPNDQFLTYVFDGVPTSTDAAVEAVLRRARACAELRLCVADDCAMRYPRWRTTDVDDDQVLKHPGGAWADCLYRIVALGCTQLDLREKCWRLHVFAPVEGVPSCAGAATVVVLQVGHALADGVRSAALAGQLFGRTVSVPAVVPPRRGWLLPRGVGAARGQRRLQRDVDAGRIPPPAPLRPLLSTNNRPSGSRSLRTLVLPTAEPTVTVAALTAISAALSGYLADRGEDTSSLGAEVPMAKSGVRLAHNHFGNVGVDLHCDAGEPAERSARIAADLADRRRRTRHPAFAAGDRATAAVPALLNRWGTTQFDPDVRSAEVIGNTVVTSVNRGAGDLRFGGCPVVLTTGCPPLSPMMGLTHGVHGIGGTVVLSVHAASSALADIDEYVDRLAAAV